MLRPSQAPKPAKGTFVCPDKDFQRDFPLVAAGLCDCWWDDGKPRDPWSIKMQMRDDGVVLTISDKDSKLIAFTTAPTLLEAFAATEQALATGGLSWRKSKW